jgi:hypothetical protein
MSDTKNIEIALRAAKLMHTIGGLVEARDFLVRRAIFAEVVEQLGPLGKAIDETRPAGAATKVR